MLCSNKDILYLKATVPKQQLVRESFKLLRDLRAKQVDRDASHGHGHQ